MYCMFFIYLYKYDMSVMYYVIITIFSMSYNKSEKIDPLAFEEGRHSISGLASFSLLPKMFSIPLPSCHYS